MIDPLAQAAAIVARRYPMKRSLHPARTPSRFSNSVRWLKLFLLGGCVAFLPFVFGATVEAQSFTTLYTFTGLSDGGHLYAGVIQDAAGNLYGTTSTGGASNRGVVFELNTAGEETVLHSFSGWDGNGPDAPITRDQAGNIYGTTNIGGSANFGTVFKVDSAGNETLLHSFTGGSDGCYPDQGLIVKSGALFGTTADCGSSDYGTIFKIDSSGNFTVVHSFTGETSDGGHPDFGHLLVDKNGNLYGVTWWGGTYTFGVLYKLSKNGTFTVLHSFAGTADGCMPLGSVAIDEAGNLYGTNSYCGREGGGNIWKVSPEGEETILHSFAGRPSDGYWPFAGVTRDSKGNLYGVTTEGGANNYGALYRLSASGKFTLLHSFSGPAANYPEGEVLLSNQGTLIGTTLFGGQYGLGTVWSFGP